MMMFESALSRLRLCLESRLRKIFDCYKCIAKEYFPFSRLGHIYILTTNYVARDEQNATMTTLSRNFFNFQPKSVVLPILADLSTLFIGSMT